MADLNAFSRVADVLAGAVAKTRAARPPMWGEWATVDNPTALTVVLDSDVSREPRPVHANAVGSLTAGQRVWLVHQGPVITIIAAPTS